MNKQELIEYCESLKGDLNKFINAINVDKIIAKIKQLDEPQKPVVKQFVADWYEKHKNSLEFNIFDYVYRFDQNEESDLKDWFDDINTNAFQTLVNMHQFGYEVERDKRYLVKMKELEAGFNLLNRHKTENYWVFSSKDESITYQVCHTRKELEDAGSGWVFSCEGIEIEEVE